MAYQSINPCTGVLEKSFPSIDATQLEKHLHLAHQSAQSWSSTPLQERCQLLRQIAQQLENRKQELATLITLEMGKLITESRAEIEKCAWVCNYYADQGPKFLQDEIIDSDANRSYVAYQPIGTVLAVMPWNFPFWQVFRFAAPALVAGNTGLLKHASNVPQSALAIEEVIRAAGVPAGVFQTLLVDTSMVSQIIEDPRVHATTLTGSEVAGRKVASCAADNIKKSVLELGGSDPFIVLDDADLDLAVTAGTTSRFLNVGQSCIAAKRFIVLKSVADEFVNKLKTAAESLIPGDPLDEKSKFGPMAREDLRSELHQQVLDSIQQGAQVVTGCTILEGAGFYYPASILDHVTADMRVYKEETFGPLAAVVRVDNLQQAIEVANDTRFGLGSSIWSRDIAKAEKMALAIKAGGAFINGMVKSDPRLPFGGVKASGFGRELSHHGLHEFVNVKTIWISG